METAVHRVVLSTEQVQEGFQNVVGLLRLDPATGFNVWLDSPDPVMLVWSPRIYEFLQVLEEIMSFQPARGLCREVGSRSGFEGATEIVKTLPQGRSRPVQAFLAMPSVLAGAGWGLGELKYDDETGHIEWTFPKGTAVGVAARRSKRRETPACAFFEGFGAGWVKGSIGADVEFEETECAGAGRDRCRFESRPLR